MNIFSKNDAQWETHKNIITCCVLYEINTKYYLCTLYFENHILISLDFGMNIHFVIYLHQMIICILLVIMFVNAAVYFLKFLILNYYFHVIKFTNYVITKRKQFCYLNLQVTTYSCTSFDEFPVFATGK